jgi:hypothetical protein
MHGQARHDERAEKNPKVKPAHHVSQDRRGPDDQGSSLQHAVVSRRWAAT